MRRRKQRDQEEAGVPGLNLGALLRLREAEENIMSELCQITRRLLQPVGEDYGM